MMAVDQVRAMLELELCGRLADAAGEFVGVAIPTDGCTIAELFACIAVQHPALAPWLGKGQIKACVNEVIVAAEARVRPGDQVALFPPVSGG